MNIASFSDGFTTLINSYYLQSEFGDQESKVTLTLDEYEKSFYLTKAQEDLVISLYTGRGLTGTSFEETEELRRYLANLVKESKPAMITNSADKPLGIEGSNHQFFTLPPDLWFITYESVDTSGEKACDNRTGMEVIPVTQDEYHTLKKNPFRGANSRRALRLDLADGVVEIICKFPVSSYYIRYLKKVKPIILEDLPSGLYISGENKKSDEDNPCELHEALHQRVLELAVRMALASAVVGNKKE